MHGWGWGMMGPFGWLGGLLLLVLIVLGIVWLWRALERGAHSGTGSGEAAQTRREPLDIARERAPPRAGSRRPRSGCS
jgi:uncharacterized membrane protein